MDQNFGERMAALKQSRGLGRGGPGRPRRSDLYGSQIAAAEETFADALPRLAQEYAETLLAREPELCPQHHQVLRCPESECTTRSRRARFNHRAAGYLFDRLLGRPVIRSENSLTVAFVRRVTTAVLAAFQEVNDLETPEERAEQLSLLLTDLSASFGTGY